MTQDITLVRDKVLPSALKLKTPPPATPEPPIGTVIEGRYQIESVIASGGMARVYRGIHLRTGSVLAIKLMDPELSKDPTMKSRCLDEARAMMGIKSNHVVQAIDVGELPSGQLYLTMEYLEGEDLDKLVTKEGPIPWSRAATMAIQICAGLASAHRRGIIHRDIKPQNCVRIEADGNPDHIKLIDFGITRKAGGDTGLTKDGFILGTPEYIAPELGKGAKASTSSDIYAVGVTLYKLLTGSVPFKGDTGLDTLRLHSDAALVLPSARSPDREIPDEADQIVAIALAKQPSDRFASADAMGQALRSALGLQQSGLLTQLGRPAPSAPPVPPASPSPLVVQPTSAAQPPPTEANSPTPAPTRIAESVTTAVRPQDERRLLMLRAMVLISVSALFIMGTWLVSPRQVDVPANTKAEPNSQPRLPPAAADARPEAPPEGSKPPSTPGAGSQKPVEEERDPASIQKVASPPSTDADNHAERPTAAAAEPVAAAAEPESTFPYAKAKVLVEEQLPFLRRTCMMKAKKPLSRLKFRIDVQPGGHSKVGVQSSDTAVRACVRGNMSFRFPPSPRGGAFEYTVTETNAVQHPVPVNPSFVQVPAP